MRQSRTVQISALNIAMHSPHSPSRYVEMLHDAFKLQTMVRLGSVFGAMFGVLYQYEGDAPETISGEIYRFVKIDPNEPWFNTTTKEIATENDVTQINIPDNLRAHLQQIPFVFRPKSHRLYFVSKDKSDSFAARSTKKLFDALFAQLTRDKQYPEIVVTVLPDQESIEQIFSIHKLEKLYIELVRPNPDDGDDDAARFLEKLEKRGARKMRLEHFSDASGSLKPDEELRQLAAVAAHNGKVWAIGKDVHGIKVEESTTAKPLLHFVPVNTNVETMHHVLERTAIVLDSR